MSRVTFLLLWAISTTAGAVVIRDDVDDSEYRVVESDFPALADMPGEGHGVLIAPRWVVTAAHAVAWQDRVEEITINGKSRRVERLVFHPGYKKLPPELVDEALESGDATRAMDFLASSDDVALLKLVEPVKDVRPVVIHRGDAMGRVVRFIGKGATGTGALGHDPHGPNRTELRQGFNTITSSEGRWLGYVFDKPPLALPLEGMSGNGDSGGPVLVGVDGQWHVAGLTSWKRVEGDPRKFRPGAYGQTSYSIRLDRYLEWIDRTIALDAGSGGGVDSQSEAGAP